MAATQMKLILALDIPADFEQWVRGTVEAHDHTALAEYVSESVANGWIPQAVIVTDTNNGRAEDSCR